MISRGGKYDEQKWKYDQQKRGNMISSGGKWEYDQQRWENEPIIWVPYPFQ